MKLAILKVVGGEFVLPVKIAIVVDEKIFIILMIVTLDKTRYLKGISQ